MGASAYTVPAGEIGPLITASVSPGAVANVRVELGYGPGASDPATTPNWVWIPAIRATTSPTVDTFTRALVIPTAGTWAYGYRVTVDDPLVTTDGITWRYTTTSTATITP